MMGWVYVEKLDQHRAGAPRPEPGPPSHLKVRPGLPPGGEFGVFCIHCHWRLMDDLPCLCTMSGGPLSDSFSHTNHRGEVVIRGRVRRHKSAD